MSIPGLLSLRVHAGCIQLVLDTVGLDWDEPAALLDTARQLLPSLLHQLLSPVGSAEQGPPLQPGELITLQVCGVCCHVVGRCCPVLCPSCWHADASSMFNLAHTPAPSSTDCTLKSAHTHICKNQNTHSNMHSLGLSYS